MEKKEIVKGGSSSKRVWALMKANKGALGFKLFLDAAFILAALMLGKFTMLLSPTLRLESIVSNVSLLLYGSFVAGVYCLLLLLIYSIVKFLVLHFIQNMIIKKELPIDRFFSFYAMNVMLSVGFVFLALVGAYIVNAAKQPYDLIVFVVLAIPFLLLLFGVLNASHSFFYGKGFGIWRSIKEGWIFSIKGKYGFILGWGVLFILLSVLLWWILGVLIKNYLITSAVGPILLYSFLFLSRLGFYIAVNGREDDSHA